MKNYILTLLFAIATTYSFSVTKIASQNFVRNWNDPNAWSPIGVPGAGDDVIIGNNRTIIINVTNAACNSMKLGGTTSQAGNGTLNFNTTGILVVTGTIQMGNKNGATNYKGVIDMTSGGKLVCGGFANSTSTMTQDFFPGTGILEVTGGGLHKDFQFFYDLTVSGSVVANRDYVILNDLNINPSGILNVNGYNQEYRGDFINNGQYIYAVSTVKFNGTSGLQTINGNTKTSFYYFEINNPDGVLLKSPIEVDSCLFLTNGIINSTPSYIRLNRAIVFNASDISYVFGPFQRSYVGTAHANVEKMFPVGSTGPFGDRLRTIYLEFNHNNNDTNIYQVLLIEPQTIPNILGNQLRKVSELRKWQVTRIKGNSAINQRDVRLCWRDDDFVDASDITDDLLRIAELNRNPDEWGTITSQSIDAGSTTALGYITGMDNANSVNDWALGTEGSSPLPVELVDFTATKSDSKVVLKWVTGSELNNDYFTVEKRIDEGLFEEIGRIKGAGNSETIRNYAFEDLQPTGRNTFYRIKQTDYDGTFEYSKVVTIKTEMNTLTILSMFPVPVKNKLNVSLQSPEKASINATITDINGRIIKNQKLNLQKGNNQILVNTDNIQGGIYFLRLQNNNITLVEKFVK